MDESISIPSSKDVVLTRMVRPRTAPLLLACVLSCALPAAASAQQAQKDRAALESAAQPPTQAEIREIGERLVANQHADDEALNFYERIERHIQRSSGAKPRVIDDRILRVVPTGGGTMKIELRRDGIIVSPAEYQRQLRQWSEVLTMMSEPGNSKGKVARAKYEKRERERAEFVDGAKRAFLPKWLDRESLSGHTCNVFELDPNPEFHPSSIFQSALAHVTAKIWVDQASDQLVRAEAWVTSDISFVAGIAGKVYRRSMVEMDQAEIAPGIWLPSHYEYDFAGRKFLFPFAQHETIDVSHYRRVGPPPEALAEVQSELANGEGPAGDP